MKMSKEIAVYQAEDGAIEFRGDFEHDTIWATQKQMAELFEVDVRTVNEHLNNIFKTSELKKSPTIRNFRIVQKESGRDVRREINHYNLDAIISVGYKVNSKQATNFRIWATKTLKKYVVDGYAINPIRIEQNKSQFIKAIEDMKSLASSSVEVGSSEVADLAKAFAHTWFSLDAYDKADLPSEGSVKRVVELGADDLQSALQSLKEDLIHKGEATELFAQEKTPNGLSGLFGNVFQSFDGKDVYSTLERKAAQLLYFVVKNHVFTDGNKRSGAFAFVWFLKEVDLLNSSQISPQALTAITLLVAESDPKEKDKMIGLILLLLGVEK